MAATYNFPNHKKGDTFLGSQMTISLNGSLIDTSLYSVRMQLRRTADKSSPVAFEYNSSGEKDGTITLGDNGIITFEPTVIDVPAGKYYHDVEFTLLSTEIVRTWVEGYWIIETEVTQG